MLSVGCQPQADLSQGLGSVDPLGRLVCFSFIINRAICTLLEYRGPRSDLRFAGVNPLKSVEVLWIYASGTEIRIWLCVSTNAASREYPMLLCCFASGFLFRYFLK